MRGDDSRTTKVGSSLSIAVLPMPCLSPPTRVRLPPADPRFLPAAKFPSPSRRIPKSSARNSFFRTEPP